MLSSSVVPAGHGAQMRSEVGVGAAAWYCPVTQGAT